MDRAIDRIERLNFRRARAQALAAALMDEVKDVLPGDFDQAAVYDRLLDVLYQNGAAWTTDEERRRYGLEPRDELGWTPSERVEWEQKKAEALLAAMQPLTVSKEDLKQ